MGWTIFRSGCLWPKQQYKWPNWALPVVSGYQFRVEGSIWEMPILVSKLVCQKRLWVLHHAISVHLQEFVQVWFEWGILYLSLKRGRCTQNSNKDILKTVKLRIQRCLCAEAIQHDLRFSSSNGKIDAGQFNEQTELPILGSNSQQQTTLLKNKKVIHNFLSALEK